MSFILISLVLLNEVYTLVVFASFKAHEDYIVSTLCVMKDVADNTCKGSCQIKRKLDFGKSKEKSNKDRPLVQLVKRFNFYRCEINTIALPEPLIETDPSKGWVVNADCLDDEFIVSIFHPPKRLI